MRKPEAIKKLKQMVEYIKEHGPQKQVHLTKEFACAKSLAGEAMKLAGYENITARDWGVQAKLGRDENYIAKLEGIIKECKASPKFLEYPTRRFCRHFSCGHETYNRTLAVIREGLSVDEAIEQNSDVAKKLKAAYNRTAARVEDRPMYRPDGRNLLTERWTSAA